MEDKWMTSVGIDLGTSTTKMIVSQLRLARISPVYSLPRYQIVERRLTYCSPIYQTPLRNRDEIDMVQVSQILAMEYRQAGLHFSDIKSGAVIITGETATKQNGEQILHYLAERAGDFVVATAGADLEGILAGKGSGALQRSRQTEGVIANIDIGGGTANVVLFERGRVVDTVTFHVGGRLLELDQRGVIQRISPNIVPWLENRGYALEEGGCVTYERLTEICLALNRSMLSYLSGEKASAAETLILGTPLQQVYPIQEIMISGGVGRLMLAKEPQHIEDVARYGDFGPLLASALRRVGREYSYPVFTAPQTQLATVIGAGMQTTEISGATVYADPSLLPIRNVPVLQMTVPIEDSPEEMQERLKREIKQVMDRGLRWFGGHEGGCLAIALSGITYCSYRLLQMLAGEFAFHFTQKFSAARTMIVICEADMAKALGQAIRIRCRDRPPVVCIDQVQVEHGDYIDLGEPIAGEMIPVVVKTLVFPKQEDEVVL